MCKEGRLIKSKKRKWIIEKKKRPELAENAFAMSNNACYDVLMEMLGEDKEMIKFILTI